MDMTLEWSYDRWLGELRDSTDECLSLPLQSPQDRRLRLRPCDSLATSTEGAGEYAQRWLHDGLSGLIKGQGNLCVTAPSLEDAFGGALTVAPCNASSFAQQWSLWNTRHVKDKA